MNNSQQQNGYQQESQSQQQNYQGDFQVQDQKRRALQARLYDSGISNIPMPSVKRPIEDRISAKPFSARMNSSKIQSVSNLKKKIQTLNTNIILKLNESYKEAAVQEAKYKGEGTADYYKQQQIVIPAPQYINTSTAGRKLQGSLGVPQAGQPRYASNLINRKGQVEPLDPEYTNNLQTSGMQAGKLMAGPPSLVYAGFEGGESMSQKNLEQARCKFLLDKLTGKLPNKKMLPPIPEGSVNGDTLSQGSAAKDPFSKSQLGEEDAEELKTADKTKKPQQWSELDKFIELLLDSKSDEETVFLYLNPNESGDPYDLQVTTYGGVAPKHYTLSSKGITEYENKIPREFLSLGQWLIERDSYNHIKTYRFFSQFNKWKFMRMWKKTIKHQNRVKAQNCLEEKLFILQDTFRSHLMKHRELMLSMSQVCFIDVCRTGDTKNIDEFTTAQMNMIKKAKKQITDASTQSRENIQKCIERVLHELRNQIMDDMSMDEDRKKQSPVGGGNSMSMKRKEANSVFDKLGFPSGMTYGHRSSLRKECLRFLRFAYLADFLSLDSLSKIYTGSVSKMIDRLESLNESIDMEKIMGTEFEDDGGSGMQAQRGQEPLFYVNVTIEDSKAIAEKEIIPVEIEEFILPPRGTSEIKDFDLLTHVQIEPEKDPNEEEEDDGAEKEVEKIQLYKQTVPNIHKFWIQLVPEKKDFIDRVLQTFSTGLESIQCFTRWSKHKDLQDYADALEEWDDMQGEWEEPESIFLNPQGWITDKVIQKTKDQRVKFIVDSAFEKSQMFIQRFQGLLEIYWRNKQFDLEKLVDEQLRNSVDTLKYTIDLFVYYRDYFRDNLPQQTDIGLLQIDSRVIKQMLAPTPQRYIDRIQELIPAVQKERTNLARSWIENSTRALKKPVHTVEDFVEQVNALQKINQFYQDFRDKVDLYQANYTVLEQSGLRVDKIDKENFKATDNEAKALQLLIQAVESDAPVQNERFKKDLQNLIPALKDEIELLHNQSKNPAYLDGESDQDIMIKQLEDKAATFKELEQRAEKYNDWQIRLETPLTQFDDLDDLREDLMNRRLMWLSLRDWKNYTDKQLATAFTQVDAPTVKLEAEKYAKIVSRLEKNLEDNPIQRNLKEMVETFRGAMPIVTALRRPELKQQHWTEINDLIGAELQIDEEGFNLQSLIDMNVVPFQEDIETIATRAVGEAKLVKLRGELQEKWKATELDMQIYKERDGVFILSEIPDLYQIIDDCLADINIILGNRFVGFMRKECDLLKKDIQNANNITTAWVDCQRDWIYLENIFTSAELRKAIQREAQDFDSVDKFFKSMCAKAAKMPSISRFVKQPQISYENIMTQNKLLEKVTKGLQSYMESKRDAFPRFYFLSDEEVLDMLAKSDDTQIVQGYLKAMFDGVVKINILDNIDVTHIKSKEGEAVPLSTRVKIKKEVDVWLMELQNMIITTLRKEMKKTMADYQSQARKDWVMDPQHYGQCVASVAQIMWCSNTESNVNEMAEDNPFALQEWHDSQVAQIEELTILVRGNLNDLQRCVVVALITTDVHARDITEDLRAQNVASTFDFEWQKQLRYYWMDADLDVKVQQIQATLMYGYEYMGATSRLVITPLTDKCWITITGALHIKLGANPAGPAGTGKTESTKDLAKAIAIYCVVYNCSDQVVYKMMKQHFKGLAQQGCWTCLDEFNRIDIEVLSVIAQLLQTIRNELVKVPLPERFWFEDADISLKVDFGCHVTMNPGYAGRTELPDNLKVLFRPVAMMVPSYQLIAEIMLGAEGFSESKILSRKMKNLYKLSSEQLSQQSHYDFGMRAVKSVLVQAGTLKRKYQELPEDMILIRAMCDANVPKFLKDDIPLFYAIVQDLFPTAVMQETDNSEIFKQFTKSCNKFNWQPHEPFLKKIVQLLETFGVRFGVMLVGYTGGGKTASYTILKDTMCAMREANHPDKQFQKVLTQLLNPKSITMDELFGSVDKDTNEWRDGLVSGMLRESAKSETDDLDWTVFDGPVDALWIENMNTVLDDNMTLCLANGQRLKLRPQMRMLFEVQDLLVASPATVSRCGMVYMTPGDLGWRPYMKSWIASTFGKPGDESFGIDDGMKVYLEETFEATIDPGLEKIRNNYIEPIVTDDLQLVKSVCNLLYVFMAKGQNKGFNSLDPKVRKKDLDAIFAWSYAWGLGGSLNEASKDFFDSVVKDLFKGVQFPPAFTVFDYFYDLKREKVFKPWDSKVEGFVYDKEKAYFDLFVNTSDTYKHRHILELLLGIEQPCFFTGTTGVGKTVVILNTLERLANQGVVAINLNFSAQTTSLQTQQSIEDKLEKSRVSFFPPPGKKVAIFVDDINMPKVEFYGAQPPIELLRLLVDRKGVFDRSDWEWKEVTGCTMIACAAPPGGGRAVVSPRLSTHFNVLCMPTANASVLDKIFKSILEGFLKTGFAEPIQATASACINSTIEIYNRIGEELRPTPAKFHYIFNLRDISKVCQGILMSFPVSIQTTDQMAKLWLNETARVFHDRLIDDNDRDWFIDLAMDLMSREFRSSIDKDEVFGSSRVMVGDILKLDAPKKLYEVIADQKKLHKALIGWLDDFNMSTSQKMNLVFFDDAIGHILRIARVLRQSRGSLMLIGMGGSGKQSLIRISSFMYETQFRQVEIKKGFNQKMFREDIKEMMFESGIHARKIAFTMTDNQIVSESFLEDLNNMLNTGEIPNLMGPEDKELILCEEMRKVVTDKKLIDTNEVMNAMFVDRVREFFHICLCMSPVGDALRVRARNFPSLVNCCTLDWFSSWPKEALLYVSTEYLKEMDLPSNEVRENLANMCAAVHVSVKDESELFWGELRRRIYTTPKSYLDLISLYINKLGEKRNEFNTNRDRLAIGLKKLSDTKIDIEEFKQQLKEAAPQMKEMSEKLAVSVEIVVGRQKIADENKKTVGAESEIVGKKASEAEAIEHEVQGEVDACEPEVKAAQAALNSIAAADLAELKTMGTVKPGVLNVMQATFILMGEKKALEWKKIQSHDHLKNPAKFLKLLVEYKVTDHPESSFKKVKKDYMSKPDFDKAFISNLSKCAGNLFGWLAATVKYQELMKNVTPKLNKLKEVKTIAAESKAELKQKTDQLEAVLAEVQALNDDLNAKKAQLQGLEQNITRCTAQLGRAETVVVLLADEGIRWKDTVAKIQVEIDNLVGNVFLSCACISYYGAFTGVYRKKLTDQWTIEAKERKIPTSDLFSLANTMGESVTIRGWQLNGLPSDQTSTENGILTTLAERWGLCIDPQQQAHKWLKNMMKDDDLQILNFTKTNNFQREISGSIRNGKPCLIEDIEEYINPAIEPVLLKQQFMADGGLLQIKLGDSVQDYDDNFKLFMTTKLANPHYPPEVCIKVTLINFTVTMTGLEEQLLNDTVLKEKPAVMKQKDTIVVQMDKDNKTLKRQENEILQKLAKSTKEQILDEDTLIDMLRTSKKVSNEIAERITEAVVIEKEIAETMAGYTSVATRGSIIYFVVADLANVNDMYQNSLQYVKTLFNKAIDNTKPCEDLKGRLELLEDSITKLIYSNIARGLFEKDKLLYSFLVATAIRRNAGIITMSQWNHLLRGAMPFTASQLDNMPPNPIPKMMNKAAYDTFYSIQENEGELFDGLIDSVKENLEAWSDWATCDNPHTSPLPCGLHAKLAPFHKLLMLRVFRPEKLLYAFQLYVKNQMGDFFISSIDTSMPTIYKDTTVFTPLVYVLSTGADPLQALLNFAATLDMGEKLKRISLGQGQGEKAKILVAESMKLGQWVMLQNCHLAASFMPDLELVVSNLIEEQLNTHPDFRLFLTSAPTDTFPVSVLQVSVKLTTEPPRGIKANLKRTYGGVDDALLESCPKKPEIWCKLFFSLAFFHSVMQERRKFGPLGFNVTYEFNDSDIETSQQMLKNFLSEQDDIPWVAMNYVISCINYGGRVTDDKDLRCLQAHLKICYQEEALNDGYTYSDSGKYYAPSFGKAQVYKDYIEQLPLVDDPEVFGLHPNANISYQRNESDYQINTILDIQPRIGGGGGGPTPDEVVLAKQKDLLEKHPETLDRATGKKELFKEKNGLLTSLTTVLLLEMEKFNRLLNVMRTSLIDLEKAIGGFIVMSETLDSMYVSLQNGRVPDNWTKVGYNSLKPLGPWHTDLLLRVEMFRLWLEDGQPNAYWLSGFFFPQGFMTGCLQTHARQYKIAIDRLTFGFQIMKEEVLEDFEEPPEEGTYIYGLFLDGARWNREEQCIDDQEPAVLYDPMSVVWFIPKIDLKDDEEMYYAPLYKTAERKGVLSTTGMSTNFIVDIACPTKADPGLWVRRAAAMLCQLSD